MISRKEIEVLASFDSRGMPVISFYLNVDGALHSPHKDIVRAHHLINRARVGLPDSEWSDEAKASIKSDLDYISKYVETEFKREDERSLAVFCCSVRKFGTIHALHCPVDDGLTIYTHPIIRPLATLIYDYPTYALALVDREKARIFRVHGDRLTELQPIHDDVHARFHAGETAKHVERHIDGQLHSHLRHVVCRLTELTDQVKLDLIMISTTPQLMPRLLQMLSIELSVKSITVPDHILIDLSGETILKQAQVACANHASREDARLITILENTAACGGAASVGTAPTLRALANKAVRTLVVQRDNGEINLRIEEVLRMAFQQHAEVKFVSGLLDWTLNGGIGALLRY